jgi:primosomal protein N'
LQMPPFGKLIKLIFQDPNIKKVEAETQKVFQILTQNKDRFTKIYEPHAPLLSKIRGSFRKQLIMKFIENDRKINLETQRFLGSLPAGWSLDVDPISII